MDDAELDRRLRAADRWTGSVPDAATLDALAAEARDAGRRSRRRRAGLGALIGALALGAGAITAPAAADGIRDFLAIAEWQPGLDPDLAEECPPESCEIAAGSEMVDLSAPDLRAYVETIYPEHLPLAPGMTRESVIDRLMADIAAAPETGFMQEVGLRERMERVAYCGWVDAWLATDDDAVRDRAAAVMAEATAWPAIVATDGGGVVAFMEVYAEQAAAGNRTAVEAAAWQWGCATPVEHPAEWFEQNTPTW